MSKDVEWTATYAATAANAFAVLSSKEFLTQLAHDTGALDSNVDVSSDSSGAVTIKNVRTFPAEVPSYAKSLVGDTITVTEIQEWGPPTEDGTRVGTFSVDFGGAPAKFGGTLSLTGNDPCTSTTSGTVKASLPLVGGKVESLIIEQIGAYMGELQSHAVATLG